MNSYFAALCTFYMFGFGQMLQIPVQDGEILWTTSKSAELQTSKIEQTSIELPTGYYNISAFSLLKTWSRLCTIHPASYDKNVFKIDCAVTTQSFLNFTDIRKLGERLMPGNLIDLSIVCNGGFISFPWPFRADNLVGVQICNCKIWDFLSEYKTTDIEKIPDTIQKIMIENSIIMMTTKELSLSVSTAKSHLVRAAECGPENVIETIWRNVSYEFADLDNLKNFSLDDNENKRQFNIHKKTCFYKNLKTFEISQTQYLEQKTVDKFAFTDYAQQLQVLNFSFCGAFDTLYKLNNWRMRFPVMKYLDLSHNNIQTVPEINDYGKENVDPTVGIIDLRYNSISHITKDMVKSFSNHRFLKVDIRENSLHCDCALIEIVNYIDSIKMPPQYNYLKSLVCVAPSGVRGRFVSSLSLSELNCSKENVMNIPAIIISISIIAIFTVIMLLIYFRNEIKIVLYSRFGIAFSCYAKNGRNDEKDYDAFIAYSEADAKWVLNTALPKLESGEVGKCFKLCLHHRDFVIGAAISDNIIRSVQNSHHTILVVSNDFLKSEWCMMEFRTALHKSLIDKNRHLIMLIKDDLNFDDLDADFKNCLSTHTYLKLGDCLFWDKLKYSISCRQKRKNKECNI